MTSDRTRWYALYVLCSASLMIVLDATIVNVALPSIKKDLGFTESSLAWVVNAYLLTYGGFLLLGGRLGDFLGARKLFIGGIVLFTVASLVCGLSTTQWMLVSARAVQGIGGATASAVSPRSDDGPVHDGGRPREGDGASSASSPRAAGASACCSAACSPTCSAGTGSSSSTSRSGRSSSCSRCGCSRPTSRRRAAAGSTSPARSPSFRR